MSRDSFVFYRSFYEALKGMDKDVQADCLMALAQYALDGEEATLTPEVRMFLTLAESHIKIEENKRSWGGVRSGCGRKKTNQVFQDKIKSNQDELENNLKNLKKNGDYLTGLNLLENKEENQVQLEKLEKNEEQKERKEKENSPLNPLENNKINKNINNTLEIKISSASSLEKPTVEEVGGETVDIEELIAEQKLQEAKAKVKKFKKPTVEEVGAYCAERQNSVNPDAFVNFYESKGWVVGKSPMKDWRAAVRTWEQKRNNDPPQEVSFWDTPEGEKWLKDAEEQDRLDEERKNNETNGS